MGQVIDYDEVTVPDGEDWVYLILKAGGVGDDRKIKVNNLCGGVTRSGVTVVTNTYAILTTDATVVGNKATPFTATLPVAVTGQRFTIKNIGAGLVTLAGHSSDTIDGATSLVLQQWDRVTVQCCVANTWIII
jgi:hypothetical protein